MIHNTKAIVLNIHKYGNSSLICNLFSEVYGKINIIAKGARSIKNPHSAILQPCNFIELIYYSKSTRKIQTLKEANICSTFTNSSYNHMIYGLTIVDIINKISFDDNPCKIIFRLVQKSLNKISLADDYLMKIYYLFFQLQLLVYIGFQPSFLKCFKCKTKLNVGHLCNDIGHMLCLKCSNKKTISIEKQGLDFIYFLMTTHIDKINQHAVENKKCLNSINNVLNKFILYHISELNKSKLFTTELENELI